MDNSGLYEIGIGLNGMGILILLSFLCICYIEFKNKQRTFILVGIFLCVGCLISCGEKRSATYKEVYYLEYTVYYPGNTCKFKVDSCNHIYASSDRGTNYIRYYSIPKKDTYGTDTTAPIVINKIIKK